MYERDVLSWRGVDMYCIFIICFLKGVCWMQSYEVMIWILRGIQHRKCIQMQLMYIVISTLALGLSLHQIPDLENYERNIWDRIVQTVQLNLY